MSEAIIVALITGACTIIVQIIISRKSSSELIARLERQSELSDQRLDSKLDKYQAVTDTKIDELTREVREHNNFAKRVPILEEQMRHIEQERR